MASNLDTRQRPEATPERRARRAGHHDDRRPRGYDAFMSYSHTADGRLAPALQRGLHRIAKPWYRGPAIRVFRDDTNLSATPSLWSSIEHALASSRFFILMASPAAAASPWVDREVAWWLAHRSSERLLIALTDGDLAWDDRIGDFDWGPTTALPPSLRGVFTEEPLWVDLRRLRGAERVSLRHAAFRESVASLAAPLHGRSKDDLVGEELRQQRRINRWRNAAVASLLVLTMLSGSLAVMANDQRNQAVRERDTADSRRLAALATALAERQPDLAQLLSLQSLRTGATGEAWRSIQATLSHTLTASRQLAGHAGPVTAVAFSPTGNVLATASADHAVRLWDVEVRQPLGDPLKGHTGPVRAVAFSADNRLLATGGDDGAVRLWDPQTRQALGGPLAAHQDGVLAVAFQPGGDLLASAGRDGVVRFWDPRTRRPVGAPLVGHEGAVTAMSFTDDGRLLATGSSDHTVRLWDPRSRRPVGDPLTGHIQQVQAVDFSPDGNRLVTAGVDGNVFVWNPRTGARKQVRFHDDEAFGVEFSPDGSGFVTAGVDGAVRLWDADTRKAVTDPFNGHTGTINAVAFSPDGGMLATGSDDTTARLWMLDPKRPIGESLEGHGSNVTRSVFSPDSALLATSSFDGKIRLWDVAKREVRTTLTVPNPHIEALAFSPDGRLLASGSQDAAVRLWSVERGSPVGGALTGHGGPVTDVAFSPNGLLLASVSADGRAVVWDPRTRQPLPLRLEHQGMLFAVAFSPDGRLLATGGQDRTVRLWNLASGQVERRFPHPDAILGVAFSPDGRLLASVGLDGKVRLWETATGRLALDPLPHSNTTTEVAFSPDGRLLASAGHDGAARLWQVATGEPFGDPITVDTDLLDSVSFSPDGQWLAATGINGTAELIAAPGTWLRHSCAIVGRNLSQDEWRRYVGRGRYVRHCKEYASGVGADPDAPVARYPALP